MKNYLIEITIHKCQFVFFCVPLFYTKIENDLLQIGTVILSLEFYKLSFSIDRFVAHYSIMSILSKLF